MTGTATDAARVEPIVSRLRRWESLAEKSRHGAAAVDYVLLRQAADKLLSMEECLRDVKSFAEGHHSQEVRCVWLHGLTVDIPHRIDLELGD